MPAKKLKPSYIANTGRYPSIKAGRSVQYESFLEKNLIASLDANPLVTCITEYPLQIEWLDPSGKKRIYTPDLLIEYASSAKRTIVEVKNRRDIRKNFEFLKFKYRTILPILRSRGYRFKLMTEKHLSGAFFENQLFLRRYRIVVIDKYVLDDLKSFLLDGPKSVASYLNHAAFSAMEQIELLPHIWAAVVHGHIDIDLGSRITNSSLLGLLNEGVEVL